MKASTALDGYVDAQGLPPEGQEDAHDDGGHGGDDGVKFKRHKRAVHRVIFMRHGECEWNRYTVQVLCRLTKLYLIFFKLNP